jgi:HlyD family secretion protein
MDTQQTPPKTGTNGIAPPLSPPPTKAVRKHRRMPRWALWTGLAAVVGLGWVFWSRFQAGQNNAGTMITAQVTRGSLVEAVSATGSVTAQTGAEIKIGSQITGVIKNLYADVGSRVKAGQLIARLNLPDLEAQVASTQAALAAARTKLAQEEAGVGMTDTQVRMAVTQAQAGLGSAQAKTQSAQATATQTRVQTPTDIHKAETALASSRAALLTARAALVQTRAGAALQIATANHQTTQTQATAAYSALDLTRQQSLAAKGYVAQSVADQAKAMAAVNQALVSSAQENVQLVQQKVTADLQSAGDTVTQAQQNVVAAQAALDSSQAEIYSVKAQMANVADSIAAAGQARAARQIALGNLPQILQKQQDVQQAQEAVRQAAAQVAYSQAQFNKSYIRSPISGTVLQLTAQQGETLAAGLSAPTLIIVADLSRLQIDAFVDEADVGAVKVGQPVQVVLDAFSKHTFPGTVSKVSAGSTIQNGVVTYDVTIAIHEVAKYPLKPDMTAAVTVQTGQRENVLLVPSVAVQVGIHGATVIVITQKDGKQTTTAMPVQTGGTDGINTEITKGLTEGQTIVVAGAARSSGAGASHSSSPFSTPSSGGGGGRGG